MATTWSVINDKLTRMLDDVATGTMDFDTELRIDAWNWAQRQFVSHTPRQRKTTLKVESDNRTAILPEDFYEIARLYDPNDNYWWHLQSYSPTGTWDTDWDTKSYTVWGNTLYLNKDVDDDDEFELWYYAYWPDVEYVTEGGSVVITSDKIIVPAWAEAPLVILTCAFCLQPKAIESAKNREFNIRVDSGRPTDNARAQEAWDLWRWYEILLSTHPPLPRGGQP